MSVGTKAEGLTRLSCGDNARVHVRSERVVSSGPIFETQVNMYKNQTTTTHFFRFHMIDPFLARASNVVPVVLLEPAEGFDPFVIDSAAMMLQGECCTMGKRTEPGR
jgi:hypothetical protein